jgi:ATP/maltotriose-dependent transcriptional regulator MalT
VCSSDLILHFLAEGLSSKEMARRLAISEATIKTHRKHLYEKLDTRLRSQAIVKARTLGLL